MRSKDIIIDVIGGFITPYIIIFAIFIQINGEVSPGGGFQAGVIVASIVILRSFFKPDNLYEYYYLFSIFGVLLYATIGLLCIILGGNYLDYSALHTSQHTAQKIGIIGIEWGVGMTVSSAISLAYFTLTE